MSAAVALIGEGVLLYHRGPAGVDSLAGVHNHLGDGGGQGLVGKPAGEVIAFPGGDFVQRDGGAAGIGLAVVLSAAVALVGEGVIAQGGHQLPQSADFRIPLVITAEDLIFAVANQVDLVAAFPEGGLLRCPSGPAVHFHNGKAHIVYPVQRHQIGLVQRERYGVVVNLIAVVVGFNQQTLDAVVTGGSQGVRQLSRAIPNRGGDALHRQRGGSNESGDFGGVCGVGIGGGNAGCADLAAVHFTVLIASVGRGIGGKIVSKTGGGGLGAKAVQHRHIYGAVPIGTISPEHKARGVAAVAVGPAGDFLRGHRAVFKVKGVSGVVGAVNGVIGEAGGAGGAGAGGLRVDPVGRHGHVAPGVLLAGVYGDSAGGRGVRGGGDAGDGGQDIAPHLDRAFAGIVGAKCGVIVLGLDYIAHTGGAHGAVVAIFGGRGVTAGISFRLNIAAHRHAAVIHGQKVEPQAKGVGVGGRTFHSFRVNLVGDADGCIAQPQIGLAVSGGHSRSAAGGIGAGSVRSILAQCPDGFHGDLNAVTDQLNTGHITLGVHAGRHHIPAVLGSVGTDNPIGRSAGGGDADILKGDGASGGGKPKDAGGDGVFSAPGKDNILLEENIHLLQRGIGEAACHRSARHVALKDQGQIFDSCALAGTPLQKVKQRLGRGVPCV